MLGMYASVAVLFIVYYLIVFVERSENFTAITLDTKIILYVIMAIYLGIFLGQSGHISTFDASMLILTVGGMIIGNKWKNRKRSS